MSWVYDSRKRILVAGGAGFLGSHLIDRLLAQGHEILRVDNLFTGIKRNVDHLHNHPRFEFLRRDVCFSLFVNLIGPRSCYDEGKRCAASSVNALDNELVG